MKRIIDGKRYDTETAKQIATWNNGYPCNDFHAVEETLYRTVKGAWFLHYDGGALSDYRESCGSNSWTGSEGIQAILEGDAKAWLMEHNKVKALEEYFSGELEDA
jgi:hypothetical protein